MEFNIYSLWLDPVFYVSLIVFALFSVLLIFSIRKYAEVSVGAGKNGDYENFSKIESGTENSSEYYQTGDKISLKPIENGTEGYPGADSKGENDIQDICEQTHPTFPPDKLPFIQQNISGEYSQAENELSPESIENGTEGNCAPRSGDDGNIEKSLEEKEIKTEDGGGRMELGEQAAEDGSAAAADMPGGLDESIKTETEYETPPLETENGGGYSEPDKSSAAEKNFKHKELADGGRKTSDGKKDFKKAEIFVEGIFNNITDIDKRLKSVENTLSERKLNSDFALRILEDILEEYNDLGKEELKAKLEYLVNDLKK